MSQTQPIRLHSDLIWRFMEMTATDDTPLLYKKWAAISLVGGALERRVWVRSGTQGGEPRLTFPNLYTFLIGSPGVGKYIVNVVRELWRGCYEPGTTKPAFNVADSNMTKASMIDRLSESIRSFTPPRGPPDEYHSLLVAAEEFGVFLPVYDMNFVAVLNEIYNAPPLYSEKRRYGPAREVSVEKPILNILGGLQPIWMGSVFPKEAWGMGLFSRVIMVYATSGAPGDLFAENTIQGNHLVILRDALKKLSILYGQLGWTEESRDFINDWHKKGGPPQPTHSKLEHYCKRRTQHIIKLAIVSSVSRTLKVGLIEKEDVIRAIEWLVEAEKFMPDIFRSMVGQSDHEVLEETFNQLVRLYSTNGRKPVHGRFLVQFLLQRVPADKVQKILEAADQAGIILRLAGTDTYKPGERKEFVE